MNIVLPSIITKTVRISIVSYLNSKPFIHGLKKSSFSMPVEIQEDIPSVCAEKLVNEKAEIGLVPVAVLPLIKNYKIISNFCIGADGPVSSVLLLSKVPLSLIKTVLLDYQSRTSVLLVQILAKEFWNIDPVWSATEPNYEKQINGNTAAVVIGDRALLFRNQFEYVYDLSEEWKKFTNLPFVFACWVSNKDLSNQFIEEFNEALKSGLDSIPAVSENEASPALSREEVFKYLNNSISFNFDEAKQKALNLFLQKSMSLGKAVSGI